MKSNKIVHHPSNNADSFSDVGTEIETIKSTATSLSSTVSALSSSTSASISALQTSIAALIFPPQGRLTLTTATPVLTASATGQTTVYYTPYIGTLIPIYDGSKFVITDTGGELSQAITDTTKSPAAVAASKVYDIFVWLDSSTKRATRGPAWSSDTARGTGAGTSELQRINGLLVNKYAITNGPGANLGTYVGSIRSNGSSQIDWAIGNNTPTAASLFVWNAYNRVAVSAQTTRTGSWTYSSATFREQNASTAGRITYLTGLQEDTMRATYAGTVVCGADGVSTFANKVAIGYDSTTVATADCNVAQVLNIYAAGASIVSAARKYNDLGVHYMTGIEAMESTFTPGTAGTFSQFTLRVDGMF